MIISDPQDLGRESANRKREILAKSLITTITRTPTNKIQTVNKRKTLRFFFYSLLHFKLINMFR